MSLFSFLKETNGALKHYLMVTWSPHNNYKNFCNAIKGRVWCLNKKMNTPKREKRRETKDCTSIQVL